jgi:amino acid transporter
MAGMLQIITYLLAFYLVMKGVEILQIALASNRPSRAGIIFIGLLAIVACVGAAFTLVNMQDRQAQSLSRDR